MHACMLTCLWTELAQLSVFTQIQFRTPCLGNGVPPEWLGLLRSVNLTEKPSIDTLTGQPNIHRQSLIETLFLGGFRLCQVDNQSEPAPWQESSLWRLPEARLLHKTKTPVVKNCHCPTRGKGN